MVKLKYYAWLLRYMARKKAPIKEAEPVSPIDQYRATVVKVSSTNVRSGPQMESVVVALDDRVRDLLEHGASPKDILAVLEFLNRVFVVWVYSEKGNPVFIAGPEEFEALSKKLEAFSKAMTSKDDRAGYG